MAKKQATKTKRPAVVAVPKPTDPTIAPSGQMLYTPRIRRIEAARVRAAVLKAASKEFEEVDDYAMRAVIGLVDLLKSRDCGDGSTAASWIGRFICDELFEVSAEGVLAIENDPGDTLEALRECIKEFELNLKDARELAERYEEFDAIGVSA